MGSSVYPFSTLVLGYYWVAGLSGWEFLPELYASPLGEGYTGRGLPPPNQTKISDRETSLSHHTKKLSVIMDIKYLI